MIYIRMMIMVLLCAGALPMRAGHAAMQEIVAVVNEDVISGRDLDRRLHLLMVSSGLPNTQEIAARLLPQVLNGLINERIMLQEAQRAGFSVGEEEIEKGLAQIAQQNKIPLDKFQAMLRQGGVDVESLRAQVRAQIAWSKVVQAKLRPRVIVSERDIDDAYERIVAKTGSTEYLTAEIFLPFDGPKEESEAANLANRLSNEIKSGRASFFQLAQQFSKSAGSANGGDVGWLNETQVEPEFLAVLQTAEKNKITQPIKTLDGYHILFLRDKRTMSEDSVPSRDQIAFTLGSQRLEKLQARYLQDLRAAAFIDIRV